MRESKLLAVGLLLAFALLNASASQAQTVLNAVGSSGVFATTGLSAITTDPVTGAAALCGTNFWSGGSGSPSSLSFATDSRNAGIPHEPGTIWVAWDSDTAPTKVCSYLSVDSVVGVRLFLAQTGAGNATLNLNTAAQFTVGGNKVSFAQDNTSCAASQAPVAVNVDLSEAAAPSTIVTVTIHAGGPATFGNDFANLASLTIASSPTAGYNGSFTIKAGSVAQLGPTTFQYDLGSGGPTGLAADTSGTATAIVAANCPGLPSAVFNAINNTHFTMAFTDIRPEDAHYTFVRATCALNPTDNTTPCMGYSSNPASPQGIKSSYSQDVAFGLDFALFGGSDPISSVAVPSGTIADIGAVPVMYIVSTRDTSACGFGNAGFTNVNIQDVQAAFRGVASATQDISAPLVSSAAGCPTAMHPLVREPFSGTFNTQEWQVTRSHRGGNNRWSQENSNVGYPQSNNNLGTACPSWVSSLPTSTAANPSYPPFGTGLTGTCGNPLNIQSADYSTGMPAIGPYGGGGGNKTRVIGTGQMVAVVNSTNVTNAFGYAFYSLGTFGGKANVKYVTLDGVDPLWPSYAGNPYGAGKFATCTGKVNLGTFSCPSGQPSYDGIKNGTYSNWNIIRALYYGSVSTCASPFTTLSAGCLIQAAQDQANPTNGNVRDYFPVVYCNNSTCSSPVQNLTYFRAHYGISGVAGHNGHVGPPFTPSCSAVPESGGDMAGAIFPVQLDLTQLNSIGCTAELTGYYQ